MQIVQEQPPCTPQGVREDPVSGYFVFVICENCGWWDTVDSSNNKTPECSARCVEGQLMRAVTEEEISKRRAMLARLAWT